jgi:hypothetical protein
LLPPEQLAAQQRINPAQVIGWGIDADPENDPTYPMRDRSREINGGLDWQRPPLQSDDVEVLRSTEHNRRPAVIGTSTPPSGLSGAMRREAFKRSEGKWSHWLMLMAADRVNVVEGVGDDLMHGRVPNIPAEMGVRSEIEHNMPGLIRKVVVAGAVLAVIALLVRAAPRSR